MTINAEGKCEAISVEPVLNGGVYWAAYRAGSKTHTYSFNGKQGTLTEEQFKSLFDMKQSEVVELLRSLENGNGT